MRPHTKLPLRNVKPNNNKKSIDLGSLFQYVYKHEYACVQRIMDLKHVFSGRMQM